MGRSDFGICWIDELIEMRAAIPRSGTVTASSSRSP